MVPKLEILDHDGNKIGDAGCAALAEAVGSGALPELKMLYLDNNETWRRRHGSAETRGIGVDIDTLLWTARPEMPGTHRVGVFLSFVWSLVLVLRGGAVFVVSFLLLGSIGEQSLQPLFPGPTPRPSLNGQQSYRVWPSRWDQDRSGH